MDQLDEPPGPPPLASRQVITSARATRERARRACADAQNTRRAASELRSTRRPLPSARVPDPDLTTRTVATRVAARPPTNRALAVRGTLGDLWGADLPPSPDPWLTLVLDALALDDDTGREHGFVVYGDGLAVEELAALLADALRRHPRAEALLARVPAVLRPAVERRLPLRAVGESV